jgi:hypothetical protein
MPAGVGDCGQEFAGAGEDGVAGAHTPALSGLGSGYEPGFEGPVLLAGEAGPVKYRWATLVSQSSTVIPNRSEP